MALLDGVQSFFGSVFGRPRAVTPQPVRLPGPTVQRFGQVAAEEHRPVHVDAGRPLVDKRKGDTAKSGKGALRRPYL